ncbi:MAG: hypothetical protein IIC09_05460, partial [Proteobacteria bacterium]|nr:hypothetical protein [Pseudomonadota bacterium]
MTTEQTPDGATDVQKAANQTQMMNEIGSSGLNRQGGLVYEEFLPDLQGSKGRKVYLEMSLNDPVIAGLLFAVEMPLRRATWTIEAQTDNPGDIEVAEFLDTCLNDMSGTWPDFISEVLTMLVYGWAWFERVLKVRNGADAEPPSQYNDGKIGWRKLAIRSQNSLEKWIFDDEGGIQAMVQAPPPAYKEFEIPIQKSLLFRTRTSKGNPEGISILRTSYRSWYYRKSLETMEAIARERHGASYPLIYLPQGAGTAELTAAKNITRNIRMDAQHGITLPGPKQSDEHPDGWLFEFVAPPMGSLGVFNEAIVRYRTEMLISTLAGFIQLGSGDTGSFALSKDQSSFFKIAIEGWAEMIAAVFNRFAIPQLVRINGFTVEKMPELRHTDIAEHDIKALGSFLQMMTVAGLITPTAATEDWIREMMGMPPITEDERAAFDVEGHSIAKAKSAAVAAVSQIARFEVYNPSSASLKWRITVRFDPRTYPYKITSGSISGTICDSPKWKVTGGSIGST